MANGTLSSDNITTVSANGGGEIVEEVVDLSLLPRSRGAFDQLGSVSGSDDSISGTPGPDVLSGDPAPAGGPGLPGALSFWAFDDGVGGVFGDARGGPAARTYEQVNGTAVAQTTPLLTSGPDGVPGSALLFDGVNDFGFIHHDPRWEVTQGTVALWLRADDLSDDAIVLSKDESGADDGGHFRLGHEDGGRIFLRFAEGDGGANKAWTSSASYLEEGAWAHVAVSFTEDGVTVYVNGVAIPPEGWYREGEAFGADAWVVDLDLFLEVTLDEAAWQEVLGDVLQLAIGDEVLDVDVPADADLEDVWTLPGAGLFEAHPGVDDEQIEEAEALGDLAEIGRFGDVHVVPVVR